MQITINGESRQVPDQLTAAELLTLLNLSEQRLAMEINREIVSRSTFIDHPIQSGDQIEIVRAIGGG